MEDRSEEQGSFVVSTIKSLYDDHASDIASKPDCIQASRQSREQRMALIEDYISDYALKAGAMGAVTGFGGITTALLALGPEIIAATRFQVLMVMHIAVIQGYPLDDATFLLVVTAALGIGSNEVGAIAARAGGHMLLRHMFQPGTAWARAVLTPLNRMIGMRFFTKAGKTGLVNIAQWVPILGAAVSATTNAMQIRGIGNAAIKAFPYYDVFISHSWGVKTREHKLIMAQLVPVLRKRGLKVWVDESNLRGRIDPAIKTAIEDSKVFVPCFSLDYYSKVQRRGSSNACCMEFDHCLRIGVLMVPVRITSDIDMGTITSVVLNHDRTLGEMLIYDIVRDPIFSDTSVRRHPTGDAVVVHQIGENQNTTSPTHSRASAFMKTIQKLLAPILNRISGPRLSRSKIQRFADDGLEYPIAYPIRNPVDSQ